MRNQETAMMQAADSHIIAMSGIRKVYDTGKVKVEALKGIDLLVAPGSSWRSSGRRARANPR